VLAIAEAMTKMPARYAPGAVYIPLVVQFERKRERGIGDRV
jgi:hypothetical protein